MKTLASIVGIGVLSMTVALAPAFAQQSKPLDQSGTTATVQPKTDSKAPATGTAGKDEKTTPVKPGTEVKNNALPAKPAPDMKTSNPGMAPKNDSKAPMMGTAGKDEKNTPAKTGSEVKNDSLPVKPAPDIKSSSAIDQSKSDTKAPTAGLAGKDEKNSQTKPSSDVKSGAVSGKSDTSVKDEKSAPVKPGANLKNDKPAKSDNQTRVEGKNTKMAVKTSHHKHASAKHTKTVHKAPTEG